MASLVIAAAWLICSVEAYPTSYRDIIETPDNRMLHPSHEELKDFFDFLQHLNTQELKGNLESTQETRYPSQDDGEEEIYDETGSDIDESEYFDYPRYVQYMPVKKSQLTAAYDEYDDEEETFPNNYYSNGEYRPTNWESRRHPDALRELEALLNDKRHNSDDNVRQLHSLLNAKSKRNVQTESTTTAALVKQNQSSNAIIVTVFENEQAASEKAAVSKNGQKEMVLLRPATPRRKHEIFAQLHRGPDVAQTDEKEESREEPSSWESTNEELFNEIGFPGRLKKRFVTSTDSLMNELHGLKHE
ncbi:uncharacterized protein LOC136030561 [Artemia franciscana]|uniref:uncharacterized protein LOC136030561 n=1 Tax=Artemia franciscana TaxID=6661 RepID=UPI0032D9F62E